MPKAVSIITYQDPGTGLDTPPPPPKKKKKKKKPSLKM